jgi:hypothetical protein
VGRETDETLLGAQFVDPGLGDEAAKGYHASGIQQQPATTENEPICVGVPSATRMQLQ